jgi:predicted DNA-binding transcriptional regulator AlpA
MDALGKQIEEAAPGELPGLIGKLEEFKARAWARLHAPVVVPSVERTPETRLVEIDEAARLLGMSKSWIYRNASTLPFVVRPNGHNLRFSVRGIEKWLQARTPRG